MIDAGTAIISEDLWRLTAAELAAAYRAGRANPVTATQAHLSRFDEVNPRLNAVDRSRRRDAGSRSIGRALAAPSPAQRARWRSDHREG
jgi:Asp-tRNA(Asn)/Glu-tRNA(Gln) amidotransferase A subunit family amidase